MSARLQYYSCLFKRRWSSLTWHNIITNFCENQSSFSHLDTEDTKAHTQQGDSESSLHSLLGRNVD